MCGCRWKGVMGRWEGGERIPSDLSPPFHFSPCTHSSGLLQSRSPPHRGSQLRLRTKATASPWDSSHPGLHRALQSCLSRGLSGLSLPYIPVQRQDTKAQWPPAGGRLKVTGKPSRQSKWMFHVNEDISACPDMFISSSSLQWGGSVCISMRHLNFNVFGLS